MEQPNREIFQLLKRMDGKPFEDDVVSNWYLARHYVLKHFNEWIGEGIGPDSGNTFNVVVDGCSPLMYSVIRQIALIAHFSNFDEDNATTRSTITVLYPDTFSINRLKAEIETLSKEEFLCNLIKYSDYSLISNDGTTYEHKGLPFVDINFTLTASTHPGSGAILLKEDEILAEAKEYNDVNGLSEKDLNAGMLVNIAYSIGVEINNLPPTENNTANRYNIALDCVSSKRRKDIINTWNEPFHKTKNISQTALKNALSCIFCADTFESRMRGLLRTTEPFSSKFLIANSNKIRTEIANNLMKLSRSEHARWVAEKLITGYRPLSEEEAYTDETSIGKRNSYRKQLKNRCDNPSHIDLISFADLKRINPEDQKYDCFIILAMPLVLKKKYGRPNLFTRLLDKGKLLIRK